MFHEYHCLRGSWKKLFKKLKTVKSRFQARAIQWFISVTKTVAFSDLQGIQVAVHNGKGDKGAPRSLTVRKFHDLLEQRRVILPVLPMFTVFGCG